MAWSEFKAIPNEYNDEFRSIDETFLKLLQERKGLSKGKQIFPPKEVMQEWANRYDMDIPQISWLMNSLNHPELPIVRNELGELLNVVPIMKRTIQDGFEYLVSHAMQHENGSIVKVDIKSSSVNHAGHIRPKLLLEIKGDVEYYVRPNGVHGGGGESHLDFLVNPRLPDELKDVQFALIPFASPMSNRPIEIVLDQEVYFGGNTFAKP
jgi:hypothetical protein